jgi:acyl carrier protein
MQQKVLKIVSSILAVPLGELNLESSYENIESWDSINHLKLIMALEAEFAVTFSDEEIMILLDVKSIVETLCDKTESQ